MVGSNDARDSQSLIPNVGVRGMTFPASFSPAFLASAVMVEVDILFGGSSSGRAINSTKSKKLGRGSV